MFSLLIQNGDGAPQRHELALGGTTIGRNPENTIVLADGSVSSRHAEIIVEDGKTILRDLNSSNGTTVNGAAATEVSLTVGDEIVFGSVVCRAEASLISEVPPPLPIIAPASPRDEVAPPPPVKEPPVQIITAQDPTSPAQDDAQAPTVSLWSKLLAFGKAASQETKRAVQIAGTKAKIEKLRRMDLSNAHYELGKKCYELRLHEDKFPTERTAIAELEKRMKEKQEGDSAEENETTGGKLKRMAGNAKQSVEAKGLSMKMNQQLTVLGKQIAESGISPAEVSAELTGVEKVNEAIRHAEKELSKLSADKSQRTQMKSLTGSISSDAGAGAKGMLARLVGWGRNHPRNALYAVSSLVVMGTVLYWKYSSASAGGSAGATPSTASTTVSSKSSDDIEKQMRSAFEIMQIREKKDNEKTYATWEADYTSFKLSQKSAASPLNGSSWEKATKHLLHSIDQYQTLILPTKLVVISRINDSLYEWKEKGEKDESFLLRTVKTTFSSNGVGELPIKYIRTEKRKLTNGFDREVALFEEVVQDPAPFIQGLELAEQKLVSAISQKVCSKEDLKKLFASIEAKLEPSSQEDLEKLFDALKDRPGPTVIKRGLWLPKFNSYFNKWKNDGGIALRNVLVYEYFH